MKVSNSVWKQWRDLDGAALLRATTSLKPDAALAAMIEVLQSLDVSRNPTGPLPDLGNVDASRLPSGIMLSIDKCDDLPALLNHIAEAWEVAGYGEITVRPARIVLPFGKYYSEAGLIRSYIMVRGRRPDGWTGPVRGYSTLPSWHVDAEGVQEVLDYAVTWLLALPGLQEVAFADRSLRHFVVTPDALPALCRRELGQAGTGDINVIATAGKAVRCLAFEPGIGLLRVADGTPFWKDLEWQAALATATDFLQYAGSWCAYSHIDRQHSAPGTRDSPQHGDRRNRSKWLDETWYYPEVPKAGKLFDAYGVLRLPQSVASALPLAPDYTAEVIGDQVIVRHSNPRAWYANLEIDPTVLAATRQRLAPWVEPRENPTEILTWRGGHKPHSVGDWPIPRTSVAPG